jgi:2-keto-4-pentenoate hydratase
MENIYHETLAPECEARLQIAAVRALLTMAEDDQRIRHAAIDELCAQGQEVIGYADEDCTAILYPSASRPVV